MTTASSERGLTLRSPGRFVAAAQRLVELCRREERARRGGPDAARRRRTGVDRCGGVPPLHAADGRAPRGGRALGAEASVNKVFWSEMDVRLHETAMRLLGPRRRARRTTPLDARASSSRWPGPSTRAPTRSSATSSPSGCSAFRGEGPCASRFTAGADRDPRRRARALRARVHGRRASARRGRATTAGCPDSGQSSASWACRACSRRRRTGGLGLTEVELVLVLEESGRFAVPEPLVEHGRPGRAAAARRPGRKRCEASRAERRSWPCGLAEAPFVAGADTASLLLLERAGELHAVERSPQRSSPGASMDGARRLHRVQWSAVVRPRACSVARRLAPSSPTRGIGAPSPSRRQLVGLPRAMLDRTVEYVKAAAPVRQAGRKLPGREAPPGRRAGCRRDGRARRLPRRLVARPPRRRTVRRTRRWPRRSHPTQRRSSRVRRSSATARSATRTRTICTCG